MYRLVPLLLILGLLIAQGLAGPANLQGALSPRPADSGESPDRGWDIDPDGSTLSSEEPDRGWAMDPDG